MCNLRHVNEECAFACFGRDQYRHESSEPVVVLREKTKFRGPTRSNEIGEGALRDNARDDHVYVCMMNASGLKHCAVTLDVVTEYQTKGQRSKQRLGGHHAPMSLAVTLDTSTHTDKQAEIIPQERESEQMMNSAVGCQLSRCREQI